MNKGFCFQHERLNEYEVQQFADYCRSLGVQIKELPQYLHCLETYERGIRCLPERFTLMIVTHDLVLRVASDVDLKASGMLFTDPGMYSVQYDTYEYFLFPTLAELKDKVYTETIRNKEENHT